MKRPVAKLTDDDILEHLGVSRRCRRSSGLVRRTGLEWPAPELDYGR